MTELFPVIILGVFLLVGFITVVRYPSITCLHTRGARRFVKVVFMLVVVGLIASILVHNETAFFVAFGTFFWVMGVGKCQSEALNYHKE